MECISSVPLGVRKGSWTEEEDDLLKKCVERYAEGKWHLVPLRAGLNRCRKSCRLRWVNYLRPNIKRGNFTGDEVDLILRLHKLLGNRWSLIAGRIPGRTSNDVKNYWNAHMLKKQVAQKEEAKAKKTTKTQVIIRPRPRTFSRNIPWSRGKTVIPETRQNLSTPSPPQLPPPWWDNMVVRPEIETGITWLADGSTDHQDPSWDEKARSDVVGAGSSSAQEERREGVDIFIDDLELWNFLGDDRLMSS